MELSDDTILAIRLVKSVMLRQGTDSDEIAAIASVIQNRCTAKKKSAFDIICEQGQFKGHGNNIRESEVEDKELYKEAVELAKKLVNGEKIPDTSNGAYFFTRVCGDFMYQDWAKDKLASAGQVGGLYLYKWI